MTNLDRRLNAFRPDLADIRLKGQVEATRFVEGKRMRVVDPVLDIRRQPTPEAGVESQALYGEIVTVFDDEEGWGWAQLETDGYVGHVAMNGLMEVSASPTHVVSAPRSFIYPGPDMKFPVTKPLSMGSKLIVTGEAETRGTKYLRLEIGGWIVANHARPIAEHSNDAVSIAARFLETPYLWGGRSGFGIDCSGLVQLSYAMCGLSLPRDSDMLAKGAGRVIGEGRDHEPLQRGDLVFWKAHVAFIEDPQTILHATGHVMETVREPFAQALQRIHFLYGYPTVFRRID